jgi:hypothetical protein
MPAILAEQRKARSSVFCHPPAHRWAHTERARAGWQGFCGAEIKAAGLFQIGSFGVPGMRHERHFGSANDVALRDVARISALISDIDRHVRLLDCDIAAEEEHALVFNNAAYPIVARTLAARRDIRPPSPRSRSDLSAFRNGPTNFRPSGIGPCCRPGATRQTVSRPYLWPAAFHLTIYLRQAPPT